MRALLAQLEPVSGHVAANVARCVELVRDAADEVELVVVPELFVSGYDLAHVHEHAVNADGPELAAVRGAAAAAGTAVVVGFVERRGAAVANALACIDETGRLAGVYRKTHLFGDEIDAFEAGDALLVVRLAGCDVGPQLCFDMEFPEPSRAMARAGARLLVTAAANMAPYGAEHELAARARALDNRLPHAYVNRVGEEGGLRFVGGTRFVRNDGRVAEQAPEAAEHLLTADIDPRDDIDPALDYLEHARDALAVMDCTPARGNAR